MATINSMYIPGQRWISTTEPELGLGTVLRVAPRRVEVLFAKSGVLRPYAEASAPLARAEFRPGQRVSGKGISFVVERVDVADGLLVYRGEGRELSEGQLDDEQSPPQADDRLIGGRTDSVAKFELRLQTLRLRAAAQASPAWGLASARVDLIPHQLRVASITDTRHPPRVLLADEVGLGKTVEAGMLIARQLATGRAGRVLVLVPDALVNQWFVELLRRFNLAFAIFDETRCSALEDGDATGNPFEAEQWVLAGLSLFATDARAAQLTSAPWDLLIVDEAHRLEWTPDHASASYRLVESLAGKAPAIALLTATPEQLGRAGHFARLRLLDPDRYNDLDRYLAEADAQSALSPIANALAAGQALSTTQRDELAHRFSHDPELMARLDGPAEPLLNALIDRHGPGRVMFRNRRAGIGGFPERALDLELVPAPHVDTAQQQALLDEFVCDTAATVEPPAYDYNADPRLQALLDLLTQFADDKFLLICRSREKVTAIETALRQRSGIATARFDEGMGIVQRDRNAAWFAELGGARVLLCSEIGSEGRNFQFAHRLFLWDLPADPDLLEQRIGRLDRIGQKHPVTIHVRVVEGSAQHVLARCYHEALDAFQTPPNDSRAIVRSFGQDMLECARAQAAGTHGAAARVDTLIADIRAAHQQLRAKVDQGRDRLLELAAEHDPASDTLRLALTAADARRPELEDYLPHLFEACGITAEQLDNDRILIDPTYATVDGLPGLAGEPRQATLSRATALVREDLPLLRLDHPLVAATMDLVLSGTTGSASFMADETLAPRSALLQAVFVLECVADRKLHVARFLPPQPIVTTVDTRLASRPDFQPSAVAAARAASRRLDVQRYRKIFSKLVPPMLEQAQSLAAQDASAAIAAALERAETVLGGEHERMTALARVNPAISPYAIQALADELAALRRDLPGAHLRLDAVRFVVSPDFLRLHG